MRGDVFEGLGWRPRAKSVFGAVTFARRGVLLATILFAPNGCILSKSYRARHERSHALDGVTIRAESRLVGAAQDSLVVGILATNASSEHRYFAIGGGCAPVGSFILVRASQGRREWSSLAWREAQRAAARAQRAAEEARRPPRTLSDGPVIEDVCVGGEIAAVVRPHDSGTISSVTFSVRTILGDSLPRGRYVLRARMGGEAWAAGEKPAGVVVFPIDSSSAPLKP